MIEQERDFGLGEAPSYYNNDESSAWVAGAGHGYLLGFRAAMLAATPAPAPGYCPQCKQYSIEEPLPAPAPEAPPAQAQQADKAAMWKALHAAEGAFAVLSRSLVLKEAIDALRERLAATKTEAKPLTLDALDEHDLCNAWAGLPIEFFNPGPCFGASPGGGNV